MHILMVWNTNCMMSIDISRFCCSVEAADGVLSDGYRHDRRGVCRGRGHTEAKLYHREVTAATRCSGVWLWSAFQQSEPIFLSWKCQIGRQPEKTPLFQCDPTYDPRWSISWPIIWRSFHFFQILSSSKSNRSFFSKKSIFFERTITFYWSMPLGKELFLRWSENLYLTFADHNYRDFTSIAVCLEYIIFTLPTRVIRNVAMKCTKWDEYKKHVLEFISWRSHKHAMVTF